MRRQSSPITIDGVEYRITALPATKSRKLFLRLGKIIAPALGMAAASGEKGLKIDDLLRDSLADLDEALVDDLCDAFAQETQIDGVPLIADARRFDEHFSGKIWSMYKWLFECLKWEYEDFLSGFLASSNQGEESKQA